MKKQTFNPLGGQHNVLRVYEVCKNGGFNLKLIPSQDSDSAPTDTQMNAYKSLLKDVAINGTIDEITKQAHVIVEVVKPDFKDLVHGRQEGLEAIEERIAAFKKSNLLEKVDETIPDAAQSLLKTAYERLAFQPYEVEIILKVSKVIAAMDDKKVIGVEHVAEAIQYRSLSVELRNP
jgi:hypothetical protein